LKTTVAEHGGTLMTLGQAGAVLADRYQLVRLVGTAIDGEIWQGQDQRLARSVTVRLARVDPAAAEAAQLDPTADDDFDVQPLVARLSRINDPGVAAVYDVGIDGGLRYAVGEWIHGRTLGQIFATGRQPWQRAADWGQQVGSALSSLHGAGIVHGTLTAESIAIQDDRRTKIIDLGLVAHTADDEDVDNVETMVSAPVGATQVMPSVRTNAAPAEAADDVYALGAVLWWAVTGMPLAYATTTSAGPDPSPLREAGAPAEFTALLLRMLGDDPADRPTASAAGEQFATIQAMPRPDDTMVGPGLIAQTEAFGPVPVPIPIPMGRPADGADSGAYAGGAYAGSTASDSRRVWAIVLGVLALAIVGVLVGFLLANRGDSTNLNPSGVTQTPTDGGTSAPVVLPTAPTTVATTAATTNAPTATTAPPTTAPPTTLAPTTQAPTTAPPTDPPTTPIATTTPTEGSGGGGPTTPSGNNKAGLNDLAQ
jgi:eukaryotic-like serine/threonine-protein kinase